MNFVYLFWTIFVFPYMILFRKEKLGSGSGIAAGFGEYFAYYCIGISVMIQAAILLAIILAGIFLI